MLLSGYWHTRFYFMIIYLTLAMEGVCKNFM